MQAPSPNRPQGGRRRDTARNSAVAAAGPSQRRHNGGRQEAPLARRSALPASSLCCRTAGRIRRPPAPILPSPPTHLRGFFRIASCWSSAEGATTEGSGADMSMEARTAAEGGGWEGCSGLSNQADWRGGRPAGGGTVDGCRGSSFALCTPPPPPPTALIVHPIGHGLQGRERGWEHERGDVRRQRSSARRGHGIHHARPPHIPRHVAPTRARRPAALCISAFRHHAFAARCLTNGCMHGLILQQLHSTHERVHARIGTAAAAAAAALETHLHHVREQRGGAVDEL